MPENVLKFSTIDGNDQHPDIPPDRHKMAGIGIGTGSCSNHSDL